MNNNISLKIINIPPRSEYFFVYYNDLSLNSNITLPLLNDEVGTRSKPKIHQSEIFHFIFINFNGELF